ncbi:ubiquitin-like protein 7 isoform X2 [Ailuropoda melanoleuca]|uniref:ubiquitin-like protein 7 isoform X2 n=1 Tax=Ailuropoda melanoleuca TaxID=9646 RepID=UPI0014943E59|nr:ubiquitin-like protein 7 isoform X2 [Ailuropoda melanoleuca]
MTRPLTSTAFNLGPQSMFCGSPGPSLIRNQRQNPEHCLHHKNDPISLSLAVMSDCSLFTSYSFSLALVSFLLEPVDKVAALREFRVLHTALHSSSSYREAVFKMLGNKESLDQIIVATPGLSSDPIALGVLQDKDLFSVFADPSMLDTLVPAHPALVNAIVLVLHSVAGSTPLPGADSSSRSATSSSYRDMPGGFLFEGLSDDEDDFHPSSRSTPSSSTPSSRPASLGYSGAAGPRPITQSELATALALASTPESSSHTPTPGTQGHSSGTSPMSSGVQSGTPITNDLFSQALQHALQASGQPSLQSQWQPQLQQLRDMGIQDDELSLRALQATGGDIQAALELIFAGGAP